jgi:predicted dehydrogenase
MADAKRVLVVGLGTMGMSHALAYARIDGYAVAGLCDPGLDPRALPAALAAAPRFARFEEALSAVKPDVVSINTWSDTHADYAETAMRAGAHVFLEKPIAETVADAERVAVVAKETGRKVVVGYILRHHPSWQKFIALAKTLGAPLVFRMNLNQQSSGPAWAWHRRLLKSLPPIVDCGVHYVDVMCQITPARPTSVHAVGARLAADIAPEMYNYGHLELTFADGSVGWYEAGWGPMMSETAFFVKDVIGPKGSVSIVMAETAGPAARSADSATHTRTSQILLHHAELAADGSLLKADERISTEDEPSHDDLCEREQRFLLKAIDEDIDLTQHLASAVKSLSIVLAADRSVRTGEVIRL